MDVDFSSGLLDTPSLSTPNICLNPLIYKVQESSSSADLHEEENHDDGNSDLCSTMPITTTDESSSISSNEMKLSKIENDLKQSFIQPRRPTESLFQKMAKAGVLNMQQLNVTHTNDGIPSEVPSTAEVVNDIESFDKYSAQDTIERETTAGLSSDNSHLDPLMGYNMGVIISPKKKLLQRSQSHTEAASPPPIPNTQFTQSQRPNFDDTSSTDDDHHSNSSQDFQRLSDLPLSMNPLDSNASLENNSKATYTIQFQAATDGMHPTLIKQHPTLSNNKRAYQQSMAGAQIVKSNATIISQAPVMNEVTSSSQSVSVKRQKVAATKSSTSTPFLASSPPVNDNNGNRNLSDDQRKKQIRDSNREAARRCRERRRQYIEQLEGNLEQCKQQIKQLNDKITQAERENTQLRAIITEAKLFHPACLSSNEPLVEFTTVIPTNGLDLHTESTDGPIISRGYYTRNTR